MSEHARERRRLHYLEAMGIQAWCLRAAPPHALRGDHEGAARHSAGEPGPAVTLPHPPALAEAQPRQETAPGPRRAGASGLPDRSTPAEDWDLLEKCVAACTACELHRNRTQTVFGVGNREATWLVIGEAPGEQEDLQGEPFVGRAGLLLNEMLRAIGLRRDEVYIANILKCRPPGNRDPRPEEVAACEGFLQRQIALMHPRIILAVGRIAAQSLLKTATPIGKLRGQVHHYQGIPLVITYHPAYLLRSPQEKRKAWQDLLLATHTFRKSLSDPS
jgi:DNA polymerase